MKQQLIILTKHKPHFKKINSTRYGAPYGVPEYGFYFHQNANGVISDALSEGYTVFAHHGNGKNYLARGLHLINLEHRQDINLLYHHFVWDEILIDNVLKTVRIYIDSFH